MFLCMAGNGTALCRAFRIRIFAFVDEEKTVLHGGRLDIADRGYGFTGMDRLTL